MIALPRDHAAIWREVASILVPAGLLSISFFTWLGQGRYVGESGMQYVHFLVLILSGLGVSSMIYNVVAYLERAFSFIKVKRRLVTWLAIIVVFLPVAVISPAFLFLLKHSPWFALLVLTVFLTIFLFLVAYARQSPARSFAEIYLHGLLPLTLFLLFLGGAVDDVCAFGVYVLAACVYFPGRPFLNHMVWGRNCRVMGAAVRRVEEEVSTTEGENK